jgi:Tfp pilus assembly protein PilO
MALGWRGSYARYKEFFLDITALYKKKAELRAFLEIILSLSTITIFLLFALKPTVVTIVSLLQQIKEKQTTLTGLTQKVNDLQKASALLQQNQVSIQNINIAVPTLAKPNILAGQVLGLAAKDSVEILGFSINQITLVGKSGSKSTSDFKPLPGDAKEMPFSVSIRGPYPNLIAFIKDFENLRVITKIDTLGVNSSVSEKGSSIVTVVSGRAPFMGN